MTKYQKIQNALSGPGGSSGRKWLLFDRAAFLIDSLVQQTPTESNLLLPASEMVSYNNFQCR